MGILPFLAVFFLLYSLAHYYIGYRFLQSFFPHPTGSFLWIYWSSIIAAASLYPLSRYTEKLLPPSLAVIHETAASYWLGAVFYLVLLLFAADLIRWLIFAFSLFSAAWAAPLSFYNLARFSTGLPHPLATGLIIAFTGALLLYGHYNATHPVIRQYDITIEKTAPARQYIKAVMVSDIHLGAMIDRSRLDELVETISAMNPDIVLLPGDIIDNSLYPVETQNMAESWRKLRPPLGKYAVLGNHDYFDNNFQGVLDFFAASEITILRDQVISIDNSFYLAGRDDWSAARVRPRGRLPLSDLLQSADRSLPLILMDHQPHNLDEPLIQGVDLQLSGHTHRGQLFPNQWITRYLYELDWGYLRKESLQVIVSCGYGTWGPPIRIGSTPEILQLHIHFR